MTTTPRWYKRMLRQQLTLWETPTPNGYGGSVFASRRLLACRWEDDADIIVNLTNITEVSMARIFTMEKLIIGNFVAKGVYTEPDPSTLSPGTTWEVMRTQELAAYDARHFLYTAWLRPLNFGKLGTE